MFQICVYLRNPSRINIRLNSMVLFPRRVLALKCFFIILFPDVRMGYSSSGIFKSFLLTWNVEATWHLYQCIKKCFHVVIQPLVCFLKRSQGGIRHGRCIDVFVTAKLYTRHRLAIIMFHTAKSNFQF